MVSYHVVLLYSCVCMILGIKVDSFNVIILDFECISVDCRSLVRSFYAFISCDIWLKM